MSPTNKQRDIIARYKLIEDMHERLAAITTRGKKWPGLEEAERTDANRVAGCSSRVWLVGEINDGRCHFRMDADSHLVKGLAALLCEIYEGGSPAEVAALEPELAHELGFDRMLSPTRLNGLASIRAAIRLFAGRNS